jgi:hypothetical protein
MACVTAERTSRRLDVATAVMLGLVSVVTAIGAFQAAAWETRSQELERDSGDARDVSVNQAVLANANTRADLEAATTAAVLWQQREATDDLIERAGLENRIRAVLVATTPGFSDSWVRWQEGGFDPLARPTDDPGYQVLRDGLHQSYAVAGDELDRLSNEFEDRAEVLAQASLIQALALFLFGIAGVNNVIFVRIGMLGLGTVAFIVGIIVALSAFGGAA